MRCPNRNNLIQLKPKADTQSLEPCWLQLPSPGPRKAPSPSLAGKQHVLDRWGSRGLWQEVTSKEVTLSNPKTSFGERQTLCGGGWLTVPPPTRYQSDPHFQTRNTTRPTIPSSSK